MRLLAFTLVLHMGIAAAQTYPTKPLKLVTPFPPGGSADVIARLAAERLGDGLGQPVVVDNRQGAGGMVGNDYASKQPPTAIRSSSSPARIPVSRPCSS